VEDRQSVLEAALARGLFPFMQLLLQLTAVTGSFAAARAGDTLACAKANIERFDF
jgi:hypothetical protein